MCESLFTYLDLAGTSHAMPKKLVEFMDQFIKEEAMLCKSMPHQHISRSNIMARIFARTLISSAENDSRDKAHQSDLQTDLLRAGTLLIDQGRVLKKGKAPYLELGKTKFLLRVLPTSAKGTPLQRALYEVIMVSRALMYEVKDKEFEKKVELSSWPQTMVESVEQQLNLH
jgi:hypothetical protein